MQTLNYPSKHIKSHKITPPHIPNKSNENRKNRKKYMTKDDNKLNHFIYKIVWQFV